MVTRCLLLALLLAACRTAPQVQVPEDLFRSCAEKHLEALKARSNWGTKFERQFLDKRAEITAHLMSTPTSFSDLTRTVMKDRELMEDWAELLAEAADVFIKSGDEASACKPVFDRLNDNSQ